MFRILVTNDDGIDTVGIKILAEAMSELGEVTVVAPSREMSGISHALTLGQPIEAEVVRPRWYAVGGTPTDCVYIARVKILNGDIDLVVSGINNGANLGEDVHYSGTVAGAVEGSIFDIPALAFSMTAGLSVDLGEAASFAKRLASEVLARGIEPRTLINVNFPAPPSAGVKLTRLGRRHYEQVVDERARGNGRFTFRIGGNEIHYEQSPETDCQAIADGYTSVTPLQIDLSDGDSRSRLAAWGIFGGNEDG
ncbi:MAG TPA: 5'/3'-nucleotidase SurE [Acidobacteriota bacterium]|nr:5'/3'-nucleotidase SurE [Acidobacteriota bacterium]